MVHPHANPLASTPRSVAARARACWYGEGCKGGAYDLGDVLVGEVLLLDLDEVDGLLLKFRGRGVGREEVLRVLGPHDEPRRLGVIHERANGAPVPPGHADAGNVSACGPDAAHPRARSGG